MKGKQLMPPQIGRFTWNSHSAGLHYTEEKGIYRLIAVNPEGEDFLFHIDVDYEIAWHKNNGDIVSMVVINSSPSCQAKAK